MNSELFIRDLGNWAKAMNPTAMPLLSAMPKGFYNGRAEPPIVGYKRTKWTNPLWRQLYRVLNYPTRWMDCSSYEECDVTFRPSEWAAAHIESRVPIYDPKWHEVKRLKSSSTPGLYKASGFTWMEIPDFDDTVLGVDETGTIVRRPAKAEPFTMQWGMATPPSDTPYPQEP